MLSLWIVAHDQHGPVVSALPILVEPPAEVQAAWRKAHEHLQAQLEFFYGQRACGTVYGEMLVEGGIPRQSEFNGVMRQNISGRETMLQASRRRKRS